MNDPGGQGWQGQPAGQPFGNQDPLQQQGWPAGVQQPASLDPAQQWQPMQSFQQPGAELIGGEPVLVAIGDISVTATTVYTPSGSRPLSEVSWTFTDMSSTSQTIPTWAIVCAIVFFLACFLGLLFLLAKENSTNGSVQVTVHGPGFVHTTTIPVHSVQQVADINARVNYTRTLTASYPGGAQASAPGQAVGGGQGQQWQQVRQQDQGQAQPGQPQQWPQAGQPGQPQPWPQPGQNPPGQPWQQDQQPGQSW